MRKWDSFGRFAITWISVAYTGRLPFFVLLAFLDIYHVIEVGVVLPKLSCE
jgi:hypothetical protein